MELQLADKLGVSRTPIREAIRMLEQEGLAITIPRKGAEVAKMTIKDMEDVLQIRGVLEELAARVSCSKITDQELRELRIAMIEFDEQTKEDNVVELAKADVVFHDIIYKAADNPKLLLLLNNLREQMYRYRIEYLKDPRVYGKLLAEHEEIIRHIESGEKEKAAKVVSQHIENQAQAVTDVIRTKKS